MARYELLLPKMGESVAEATVNNWLKQVGDTVEMDEGIVEVATDKVDNEIPSPVEGVVKEILFQEGDTAQVGQALAIIEIEGEGSAPVASKPESTQESESTAPTAPVVEHKEEPTVENNSTSFEGSSRFYSPLVKNIAKKEGIGLDELEAIPGTGKDGRVTKEDMLSYVEGRGEGAPKVVAASSSPASKPSPKSAPSTPVSVSGDDEIIEMSRMRKLIADHMVRSKDVSPHVWSYVEADMTNIVLWRNKHKDEFFKREGVKLTFTPIILEAIAHAIKDFPMINVSVADSGDKIIVKKNINIGMATALPSGDLIVPVLKNADRLNLTGVAKEVGRLANSARTNSLTPDDIQGGTFTFTNVGSFGNVMGAPIINQPQVAILSAGVIQKKPAVIETPQGDVIGIRHKMFISLGYDHRVVDGMLGGSFLKRVADYLDNFDLNRQL